MDGWTGEEYSNGQAEDHIQPSIHATRGISVRTEGCETKQTAVRTEGCETKQIYVQTNFTGS